MLPQDFSGNTHSLFASQTPWHPTWILKFSAVIKWESENVFIMSFTCSNVSVWGDLHLGFNIRSRLFLSPFCVQQSQTLLHWFYRTVRYNLLYIYFGRALISESLCFCMRSESMFPENFSLNKKKKRKQGFYLWFLLLGRAHLPCS